LENILLIDEGFGGNLPNNVFGDYCISWINNTFCSSSKIDPLTFQENSLIIHKKPGSLFESSEFAIFCNKTYMNKETNWKKFIENRFF